MNFFMIQYIWKRHCLTVASKSPKTNLKIDQPSALQYQITYKHTEGKQTKTCELHAKSFYRSSKG